MNKKGYGVSFSSVPSGAASVLWVFPFPEVSGCSGFWVLLWVCLATPMWGTVYDLFGTYTPALIAMPVVLAASVVCILGAFKQ